MKKTRALIGALALLSLTPTSLAAGNAVEGLESYRCREFISDVSRPDTGDKLVKATMLISWATGYASAHQTGAPRASARSFQLIAAALGDTCKRNPDAIAVVVFSTTITALAK